MRRARFVTSCLALLALGIESPTAFAAWPHDPNNGNVPVAVLATSQSSPATVSDGAGGAIVFWVDQRNGNADIYAQRISASGAPLWPANGVALCTATGSQLSPVAVADGAGGAIVIWQDARGGVGFDLYAQRVSAAGAPQWIANGVAVCTATGDQSFAAILTDGAGGMIAAWQDSRGATLDVYAQRVSAAGTPQWTANGVVVCSAASEQSAPGAVTDGSGGALIAWKDLRSGAEFDIYAQRLNPAGAAQWAANGVAVCTAGGNQYTPTLATDGVGGALIAWYDYRNGVDSDAYMHRINGAGGVLWTLNGVALSTAAGHQYFPQIVSDGAGGAIAVWQDERNGVDFDIYAQRVAAGGAIQWAANGMALCTAATDQGSARIATDGSGGAIMVWNDGRGGVSTDLYAQRVSATGAAQWASNGTALCTAAASQDQAMPVTDGAGGVIVAWADLRNANTDIYAQRIERYGQLGNPEAVIRDVKDLPNDQGGFVKVSWDASYLDADPTYGVAEYRLFRSAAGPLASGAAARRAVSEDSDVAVREGALLATSSASGTVYWEYVGTQAAEALAGYSRVVATTSDSVAGGNPPTWFMVEARASTSVSSDRWFSAPDSGYSVDNLAPATPAPFTGQYGGGATALHWNPNSESDLAGYRLYRGTSLAFVPGPGSLVAALEDTGYVDPAGQPYVYKLTAVDVHGNESPVATLVPSGALGVGEAPAPALAFAAPGPNPAVGATTFRWTLSRPGRVRLAIYDAAGRRVALLRDGELPAGEHAARFELRDEAGRPLASGLYLARLEAEGRELTRRFAALR